VLWTKSFCVVHQIILCDKPLLRKSTKFDLRSMKSRDYWADKVQNEISPITLIMNPSNNVNKNPFCSLEEETCWHSHRHDVPAVPSFYALCAKQAEQGRGTLLLCSNELWEPGLNEWQLDCMTTLFHLQMLYITEYEGRKTIRQQAVIAYFKILYSHSRT
jgi:hypothetical protein